MKRTRKMTFSLLFALAVLLGLIAAAWSGAVWFERRFSIPSALSLGAFFGAMAFAEIIKRINRRDDPRHSKRPPDPP
jgi:hypothetical protein